MLLLLKHTIVCIDSFVHVVAFVGVLAYILHVKSLIEGEQQSSQKNLLTWQKRPPPCSGSSMVRSRSSSTYTHVFLRDNVMPSEKILQTTL